MIIKMITKWKYIQKKKFLRKEFVFLKNFICYLALPQLILTHLWEGSLNNSILITVFHTCSTFVTGTWELGAL